MLILINILPALIIDFQCISVKNIKKLLLNKFILNKTTNKTIYFMLKYLYNYIYGFLDV
jgi:hypothetical protein